MSRKRISSTKDLQRKSLAKAHNHGQPWTDREVERLVAGIERDETSYEIALAVGRSYYSTMAARAHVAFALRHADALQFAVKRQLKKQRWTA